MAGQDGLASTAGQHGLALEVRMIHDTERDARERDARERDAVDDLILGRGVRRGRHDLGGWERQLFEERLAACGFVRAAVATVDIEVGVRVPAWLVTGPVVDFGMVFWEVFTDRAKRKLFASEIRNPKGDWDVQIGPSSPREIFVNLSLAERYDASRPVGMF